MESKQLPRFDEQLIMRDFALSSMLCGFEADIQDAGAYSNLEKHFTDREIIDLINTNDAKKILHDARMFVMHCKSASVFIINMDKKTKVENDLTDPKYLTFIKSCQMALKFSRNFKKVLCLLTTNCSIRDKTISNKDYYEARQSNPRLQLDDKDKEMKKMLEKKEDDYSLGGE